MYVNSINLLPQKVSFNGRLTDKIYQDLNQVEGLPCAICGKRMYTQKELEYILDSFSPSMSEVMKDPRLSDYKNTNAYSILCGLAKKHPKTPLKNAISDPDFKVKFQFLPEYTQQTFYDIVAKTSNVKILASDAIKKIEKLKSVYPEDEVEIIDTLKNYAEKYPDKSFHEIFRLPEVFNFHLGNIRNYKSSRLSEVDKIMSAIQSLSAQLPKHEQEEIRVIENEVVRPLINRVYRNSYIRSENNEKLKDYYTGKQLSKNNYALRTLTKRINILSQYDDLLRHSSKPDVVKKIRALAEKLPFKTDLVDFYILDSVKNSKTDKDIIWDLLNLVANSYDHIIPRSKNGSNDLSNGLRVHKVCNEERDVIPYSVYSDYRLDLNQNLQKQISTISSLITHEKLLDNDDYPIILAESMSEASNGKIQINTSKFVKAYKQMLDQKMLDINKSKERLSNIVENCRRTNNLISKKIEDLKKEIENLERKKETNRKIIKNAQKCLQQIMYDDVNLTRKYEDMLSEFEI